MKKHQNIILVISCLAIILASIELDILLPSLPVIQRNFSTTEAFVQLLLTMNFIGLAISCLLYGPLSDSIGRRKVLIIGLGIFAISSFLSIQIENLYWLIFWRFWQGIGSSVGFVVPIAVIYDLYSKDQATSIVGIINSIITCGMAAAPMIGSYLCLHYNWQSNFYLMLFISFICLFLTVFFYKETLRSVDKQKIALDDIIRSYKTLVLDIHVQKKALSLYLIIAGFFLYITNLSLIFINYMNIPETVFPVYQGCILAVFALVSLFVKVFINYFGNETVKKIGISHCIFGSLFLFCSCLCNAHPLFLTLSMIIYSAGLALIIGILFGEYIEHYSDLKGAASALFNTQKMIMISLSVTISGVFFNGTMLPVAIMILIFTCVSAYLVMPILKQDPQSAT